MTADRPLLAVLAQLRLSRTKWTHIWHSNKKKTIGSALVWFVIRCSSRRIFLSFRAAEICQVSPFQNPQRKGGPWLYSNLVIQSRGTATIKRSLTDWASTTTSTAWQCWFLFPEQTGAGAEAILKRALFLSSFDCAVISVTEVAHAESLNVFFFWLSFQGSFCLQIRTEWRSEEKKSESPQQP